MFQMKEIKGIIILLYYTENTTLKQTLNGSCATTQHLAWSVCELPETFLSHSFIRKGTFWVYKPQTGQHLGRAH